MIKLKKRHFLDSGHRGPCNPYKLGNHNLYTGIIIYPHIDNTKSTGYIQIKKNNNNKETQKSEGTH